MSDSVVPAAEAIGLDQAPFSLDSSELAWVKATFEALGDESKLGLLLLPHAFDVPMWRERVVADAREGRAGLYRFPTESDAFLAESLELVRETSAIPPLLPTDIEFDEIGGLGDTGTQFPNQLTVAAAGSLDAARRMALVAAREGAEHGYNWSFTPVVDVSFERRNTLVTTRSFGSDPERVASLGAAYIDAMERTGMASCAKHFPGDGVDERDQHLTVTRNSLALDTWWASYGVVWQAAIAAGTRTVMPGHISLPAYGQSVGLSSEESHLPATLSPALLEGLLRGELGFRGLIVSDASEMGGFGAAGARSVIVPACIEAGCDVLLFPLPGDLGFLHTALADGRLSRRRLNEAVLRILALTASLSRERQLTSDRSSDRTEHARWAQETAEAAVTLVRDRPGVLPLRQGQHIGVFIAGGRVTRRGDGQLPALVVPELLREQGFDVTVFDRDQAIEPAEFDVLLYLVAEESRLARLSRRLPWPAFSRFPLFMRRYLHDVPCILVSFGDPHYLWDSPTWPTLINAYSPVPAVQRATVMALTGDIAFQGDSPVNAFDGVDPGEMDLDKAVLGFDAMIRGT